jgi:hypothetical protein
MECNICHKIYKTNVSLNKHSKKCKDINGVKDIEEIDNNKTLTIIKFDIDTYLTNINDKIKILFNKSIYNEDILEDILLNNYIKKNENIIKQSKKLKQIQMNIGKIWQLTIGNYKHFIDLGEGHITGLDVKSDKLKIIMEIKNRYNTDNASAKKANYDKLVKFKINNPDYKCIYAIINDKTKNGKEEIKIYNEYEIIYLSGNKLFEFIFGSYKDKIIVNLHKQLEHL